MRIFFLYAATYCLGSFVTSLSIVMFTQFADDVFAGIAFITFSFFLIFLTIYFILEWINHEM